MYQLGHRPHRIVTDGRYNACGRAKRRESRRANLSAYSLRYWPKNALQRGQTARANTPYGVLTCASIGPSHPRQCSLQ